VGLDLGGPTPESIALAIAAELHALFAGRPATIAPASVSIGGSLAAVLLTGFCSGAGTVRMTGWGRLWLFNHVRLPQVTNY
jgi:hypothetical protein